MTSTKRLGSPSKFAMDGVVITVGPGTPPKASAPKAATPLKKTEPPSEFRKVLKGPHA